MKHERHLETLARFAVRKQSWALKIAEDETKLAPRFNVFDFLRTDELGLSEVLRWLLDPRGSHGQRDAFLKAFLETFAITQPCDTDRAVAKTEVVTDRIDASRRRIDIHVSCPDFHLAVENKPDADWQTNQVRDYLGQLQAEKPGQHVLVLLKGRQGQVPESQLRPDERQSLERSGRLIDSDYVAVIEWVERCAALNRAKNVGFALSDLSRYLRQRFIGGTTMDEAAFLTTELREDGTVLRAAFDLIESGPDLFELIFQDLELEARRLTAPLGWAVSRDPFSGFNMGPSAMPLHIDFGNCPIVFCFVASKLKAEAYIGIRWRKTAEAQDLSALTTRLAAAFPGHGLGEYWWPWWHALTNEEAGSTQQKAVADFWVPMNDTQEYARKIVDWSERAREAAVETSVLTR